MAKREQEGREADKRKASWSSPRMLPDPEPEEGYRFRWVRTGSAGSSDTVNVSMRFREGYVPVALSEHPEMHIIKDERSRFPDAVEVGGLLLCKIPEENAEAREETQVNQAHAQIDSVENHFMRESDPRMPLQKVQRQSKVSMGRKR